jgi:selenocysteine lyase/cysteine desulfurase
VTVRLPNGSVRASLGYMSRFEDVYALVDWLYKRYVLQHAFVSMHSLQ